MIPLTARERALLDRFQRDLPVCEAPFAAAARTLRISEDGVLSTLSELIAKGVVDRVGPIFRPGSIGASTLAAMAVPPARLGEVAPLVSARRGVNHNYAREHAFNLWFVAHAEDSSALAALLGDIERSAGLAVVALPLVREYHIDLGFALDGVGDAFPSDASGRRANVSGNASPTPSTPSAPSIEGEALRVARALEEGLPLVTRPFALVATRAGLGEDGERRVCGYLRDWLAAGVVKRMGAIVRHRPLGYVANLMAVWDVPQDAVDAVGRALAAEPCVTLCYRRAPAPPAWPYNLFCMLHGQDRARVAADADALVARHGLARYPHARLFSTAEYKQTGARRESRVANG